MREITCSEETPRRGFLKQMAAGAFFHNDDMALACHPAPEDPLPVPPGLQGGGQPRRDVLSLGPEALHGVGFAWAVSFVRLGRGLALRES